MTGAQLKQFMPECVYPEAFAAALNAAMPRFDITTPARQFPFLAQLDHESRGLSVMTENLNYSAEALLKTFNTAKTIRFTPELAARYGRTKEHAANQRMIANIAYANRMHNGDVDSGDGWRYRGAGPLQITGKENHLAVALYFDQPLEEVGNWMRTPEGGCLSAAWFWQAAGCNAAADAEDFDKISDLINIGRPTKAYGDANGFKDRLVQLKQIESTLGVLA